MSLPDTSFDVYFADHDALIECTALDAVEYDSPADWPPWVDDWRFVPSADDVAWLNTSPPPEEWEPSPEDWRDFHEYCLEQERLDALRRMEDREYELRMRYGD